MPRDDLLARLRAEHRAVMGQARPVVNPVRHPNLYGLARALHDALPGRRKLSWSGRRWPILHTWTARYACDPETRQILVGTMDL